MVGKVKTMQIHPGRIVQLKYQLWQKRPLQSPSLSYFVLDTKECQEWCEANLPVADLKDCVCQAAEYLMHGRERQIPPTRAEAVIYELLCEVDAYRQPYPRLAKKMKELSKTLHKARHQLIDIDVAQLIMLSHEFMIDATKDVKNSQDVVELATNFKSALDYMMMLCEYAQTRYGHSKHRPKEEWKYYLVDSAYSRYLIYRQTLPSSDSSSDFYSLVGLLYYCLTGHESTLERQIKKIVPERNREFKEVT